MKDWSVWLCCVEIAKRLSDSVGAVDDRRDLGLQNIFLQREVRPGRDIGRHDCSA